MKKPSLKILERKANRLLTQFIRENYRVGDYCQCYTCELLFPLKKIDAGHYLSRRHLMTKYNFNNVRPQCKKCNGFEVKYVYMDIIS